jgi:serine/threonine protein kinase
MLNKGDKIKNHVLEKYLGEGSFGEVWLAKKQIELSDEGILVALKFLKYKPSKDETQEKFIEKVRREVATWIKASGHKNIVSVQDGFQFQTDTFVIVSDFADGGDLGSWLKNNGGKSPDLRKTVEIFCEILEGLQHLHTQTPEKIIHRDLKPDNILFKNGLPCITDFGVSRMSNTVSNSMVKGSSAGTPLYMSPEVLNNKPASRSMDIWSMGIMLYEMLAGNYPYFPKEGNIYSLILDIIQNPYQPLPADIPFEFQRVVAKALEKDVNKRYQSAVEMRSGLKTALKVWEGSIEQAETIEDEKAQNKHDFEKKLLTEQTKILQQEEIKFRQRYNDLFRKASEVGFKLKEQPIFNNEWLNRFENQIYNFMLEKERKPTLPLTAETSNNLVKWVIGGLSVLLFGVFGFIGINSLSGNRQTVSNTTVNKPLDKSLFNGKIDLAELRRQYNFAKNFAENVESCPYEISRKRIGYATDTIFENLKKYYGDSKVALGNYEKIENGYHDFSIYLLSAEKVLDNTGNPFMVLSIKKIDSIKNGVYSIDYEGLFLFKIKTVMAKTTFELSTMYFTEGFQCEKAINNIDKLLRGYDEKSYDVLISKLNSGGYKEFDNLVEKQELWKPVLNKASKFNDISIEILRKRGYSDKEIEHYYNQRIEGYTDAEIEKMRSQTQTAQAIENKRKAGEITISKINCLCG